MMLSHTPGQDTSAAGPRAATATAAFCAAALLSAAPPAQAQELVIGEERIAPGIVFIFEGAVRDHVLPRAQNLRESMTHVHIEARVNWAETGKVPPGTPRGGFVPYLNINAMIFNQVTREAKFVTLLPHINLIDNFHYARNVQLPGSESDLYTVDFYVNPPGEFDLARHRDWLNGYESRVLKAKRFRYRNVDFMEIVTAPPRSSAFEVPDFPQ